jgi:cell division protein FtsB
MLRRIYANVGSLTVDRLVCVAFVLLIAAIQYPLWAGKGGWLRVWDLERKVSDARGSNGRLQARNDALELEVRDLKDGLEAIEDYARRDLGMIRPGELLYQVGDRNRP